MKVVTLYQIKRSFIDWYFTEAVESGEQVYFYKDEEAEKESNRTSLCVVDVIKETDDYFYIIAEDVDEY